MDFDLTEEQNILKKSVRDFFSRECPKALLRKLEATDQGLPPDLWNAMAQLGWMGLMVPEEYGGSGGSFLDLTLVLEEMGYALCPGPFFSCVVLGGLPIVLAGTQDQKEHFLPGLVQGTIKGTLALNEPGGGYEASSMHARGRREGDRVVVEGTKLFVLDAHIADYIIWVARTGEGARPEEGITMCIVEAGGPGVTRTLLRTISREKHCEVVLDGVAVPMNRILGRVDQGWYVVKDIVEKAALARAAEMVGGAQAVMDMAVEYAKNRVQFDRPIGSFQAIQHYVADMWIDINGSRMLLYKAAWKTSKGMPSTAEIAMAKAHVGDTYRRVTTLGHQIFGGIGFTMEHDMHLYHRRAISGDVMFGDADAQRETVVGELGLR